MLTILKNAWPLLFGMLLLMIGNGLQGTVLGIRGGLEGFSPVQLSYVMSGYFLGFLGGSKLTPVMIRRVGHVRVFAALGSLASAAFILYAAFPDPAFWTVMRIVVGFCFSGVYVVSESWLNDAATNETRGQALSVYALTQTLGLLIAQASVNLGDIGGYIMFVAMSVLVSVSFAPILLSVSPAPVFHTTKAMSLRALYDASPLGIVGIFLMGGVFASTFGMASVYGAEIGMTVRQISIFVGLIYFGGLLTQYPIGWMSDRMGRRSLIIMLTGGAGIVMLLGSLVGPNVNVVYVMGLVVGAISMPMYSLLLAYTNDYLQPEDMAAASGGMIFINGIGAVGAPILQGWLMSNVSTQAFFLFIAALFLGIAAFGIFRTTQREALPVSDTATYAAVMPQGSPVLVEVAQEYAADIAAEAESEHETPKSST